MITSERLRELLAEYIAQPLSLRQTDQLLAYLDLLLKWNAKTNLTAIREPEQIVRRHFGESLALAELVTRGDTASMIAASDEQWKAMTSVGNVADFGSGAGFPGQPFAIYVPHLQTTLIESQNKKATFLKEVVRALGLTNALVLNQRGEDIREKFDVVMMRAVDKFENALQTAAQLVRLRGRLVLLISEGQIPAAQKALRKLDVHWGAIERDLPGRHAVIQVGYF